MGGSRKGMTLLELILALGLTVLVFVAIAMALDLNLRTLDSRRTKVEEAQLARAVLRRISDDLRGAVQTTPLDFSAAAGAAEGSPSPSTTGGQNQNGTGQGGQNQNQGGQDQGGGNPSGQNQGGQNLGSGSQGGLNQGSQSPQGGTSPGTGAGTGSGETENTEDIASAVVPPAKLGLYGNQFQLQIDVSHLPRPDQYNPQLNASGSTSALSIPSDVKTVAYFMQAGAGAGSGTGPLIGSTAAQTKLAEQRAGGLVRREIDRAVASYAGQNGTASNLNAAGDVLAPEVTSVQFQYFNGTTWTLQWDSEANDGLPLAVKILITVRPAITSNRSMFGLGDGNQPSQDLSYGLVVHLPLGKPPVAQDTGMESLGL